LHQAASNGHEAVVLALIASGADINFPDNVWKKSFVYL